MASNLLNSPISHISYYVFKTENFTISIYLIERSLKKSPYLNNYVQPTAK